MNVTSFGSFEHYKEARNYAPLAMLKSPEQSREERVAELATLPIASFSAIIFYFGLLSLCLPRVRALVREHLLLPERNTHLAGCDAVRAFSMLMLALGHGYWFVQPVFNQTTVVWPFLGYTSKAVGLFTVLSGFLIYRSVRAINTFSGLGKYITSRFFRIYPVYLVSIFLGLAFSQYKTSEGLLSDVLMSPVFNFSARFSNPVCWSLYVEVLFYSLIPLSLLVPRKFSIALSLIALVALSIYDTPNRVSGLWRYFFIGIIASELSEKPSSKAVCCFMLCAGISLLLVDFRGPDFDWAFKIGISCAHPALDTLGLGIAIGLILIALPNLKTLSRILDSLPIRLMGAISYSFYLTHLFFILINFPSVGILAKPAIPLSIPLPASGYASWFLPLVFVPGMMSWATLCYVLVERPGIMLGRMMTRKSMSSRLPATKKGLNAEQADRACDSAGEPCLSSIAAAEETRAGISP